MTPQYPINCQVEEGVKEFISSFYAISDTPGKHEDWLNFYSEDATVFLASGRAAGHDEILKLRHKMWEYVAERKHAVKKVFPALFQQDRAEFMLFGTVDYVMRTGEKQSADWSGHAILKRDEQGQWKFEFYRVYM